MSKQFIPKIIHYCWFGGKPLPELAQRCLASWQTYCPEYKIIRWDEKNYDINKNLYMKQAYEEKKWGFVPDFARLDIINMYGGIYLDTDVELIKKPDELLNHKAFMGIEDTGIVAMGLGFGAVPGHSVIKKLLNQYEQISFINEDGSLNLIPSPALQSEVFYSLGVQKTDDTQIIEDDCVIYAKEYLCPKDNFTREIKITENTVSIHHYDASWCTDKTRYYLKQREKHSQNLSMFLATAKYDGLGCAIKESVRKITKK